LSPLAAKHAGLGFLRAYYHRVIQGAYPRGARRLEVARLRGELVLVAFAAAHHDGRIVHWLLFLRPPLPLRLLDLLERLGLGLGQRGSARGRDRGRLGHRRSLGRRVHDAVLGFYFLLLQGSLDKFFVWVLSMRWLLRSLLRSRLSLRLRASL
jgi:hypothetical protein